jgi:hypothetical protein
MAPYQHNGFLGDDIKLWMENNRLHYIDLFNQTEKLNSDCYSALGKARPHNGDKRELTVSCLFPRTMELFQGTYLLISRGMIPSSNVILRTLIETMFVLVAITKDNDALDAYILNDEAERLKTANKVIHDKHSAILGIPIEDAERIKAEILAKQIKKWSVEDFAKKAELYDWYLTVYAFLCGPVHAGIKDLEQYLKLDENNKVESIEFVPTDKGTNAILTTACSAQNMALQAFLTSLNLDTGICTAHAESLKPFMDMAIAEND